MESQRNPEASFTQLVLGVALTANTPRTLSDICPAYGPGGCAETPATRKE
jgi:hypothetical protein